MSYKPIHWAVPPVKRWEKLLAAINCPGDETKANFLEHIEQYLFSKPKLKEHLSELIPAISGMIKVSTKLEHDPIFKCSNPLTKEQDKDDMFSYGVSQQYSSFLNDNFPSGPHAYLIVGAMECYTDQRIHAEVLKIHYAVL